MIRDAGVTRREALVLLGIGARAGLVSVLGDPAEASGLNPQSAAQSRPVTFSRGAIIRTVLKDVPPEALAGGAILFHEHLSLHNGRDPYSDDVGVMAAEVKAAAKEGGITCIVDGGHADMNRNVADLRRIDKESGVPIVASGGYYTERSYPPEIATKSIDRIADDLVKEAGEQRFGAYGEIGQAAGLLTEKEQKVFRAVGRAHSRNGLPIFTHNPYVGTQPNAKMIPRDTALRQLDALEAGGGDPKHICIGHVCCLDDPQADVAVQLAKRGVFVGFDRATSPTDTPGGSTVRVLDEQKAKTVVAMCEAGYADHVLISSDFSHGVSMKKNGGPGIAMSVTIFEPMLRKAGLPQAAIRAIRSDNTRRFLAFVPRPA
jgi:phosphotriesterase-related protein